MQVYGQGKYAATLLFSHTCSSSWPRALAAGVCTGTYPRPVPLEMLPECLGASLCQSSILVVGIPTCGMRMQSNCRMHILATLDTVTHGASGQLEEGRHEQVGTDSHKPATWSAKCGGLEFHGGRLESVREGGMCVGCEKRE